MPKSQGYTADFLGDARRAAGYTQKEVADKTGIPLGTIRRWEQGQNDPDMGSLMQLAELYNASLDSMIGLASVNGVIRPIPSETIAVPLLGSITAGTPIEMIAVEDTYDIPTEVHNSYPKAFLLKVAGESMNRVLPNGCYALINPCDTVEHPMKAYAVCVNGFDATIKRVKVLENGYELIPDSNDPTFRSQIYDYNEPDTDPITVIGQVVWYMVPFGFEI